MLAKPESQLGGSSTMRGHSAPAKNAVRKSAKNGFQQFPSLSFALIALGKPSRAAMCVRPM